MRRTIIGCLAALLFSIVAVAAASDVADAVMNRDDNTLRTLLQQKADVNAAQTDGTTALQWAVRHDDLSTVDQLIRAGADVNAANRDGATAMYLACINGDATMVDKLLKAGVDANSTFLMHKETPLMEAARTGNVAVVRLLLDRASCTAPAW